MFFKTFKVIGWILAHILYRFEITGRENIPEQGAFLLCANHIHAFDPVILAIFMKRQPRFMGKKELFEKKFLDWFFRNLGAYPLDRQTADMKAYRTTMNILKDGNGVMIFSQGTRMKDFENVKGGVAVFALKSGAPIVPAGIIGSYKLFSKIRVNIGKPILMDEYAGQRVSTELVERVMGEVVGRVSTLSAH
ncbi:MAG: 1-acyl-sn-glycerol-3-phosphate acyltransferase [Defluviitaleaceae bacterium]|nr:1-acyl-sn-glycerol-3-phosphate acyltransferase [Defluviitaleaceae bacterium]